jgi:hypothetical protein
MIDDNLSARNIFTPTPTPTNLFKFILKIHENTDKGQIKSPILLKLVDVLLGLQLGLLVLHLPLQADEEQKMYKATNLFKFILKIQENIDENQNQSSIFLKLYSSDDSPIWGCWFKIWANFLTMKLIPKLEFNSAHLTNFK